MYKRIDFNQLQGLAVYQDTLDFLQTSYREACGAIASVLGDYVIISGVTDQGTTYSNGWVAINGELLPFVGGLKAPQVIIEELTDTEVFSDDTNKTVYYTRRAKLGNSGGYAIANFVRLQTLKELKASIEAEATARANADTTLQNNINTEATSRSNADTTLQNNINAEATARTNADTTLQNNINAEATARANAVSAEATARTNADNAEATARANADTTLQNNINAEANNREIADAALDDRIEVLEQGNISESGVTWKIILTDSLADFSGLTAKTYSFGPIPTQITAPLTGKRYFAKVNFTVTGDGGGIEKVRLAFEWASSLAGPWLQIEKMEISIDAGSYTYVVMSGFIVANSTNIYVRMVGTNIQGVGNYWSDNAFLKLDVINGF